MGGAGTATLLVLLALSCFVLSDLRKFLNDASSFIINVDVEMGIRWENRRAREGSLTTSIWQNGGDKLKKLDAPWVACDRFGEKATAAVKGA